MTAPLIPALTARPVGRATAYMVIGPDSAEAMVSGLFKIDGQIEPAVLEFRAPSPERAASIAAAFNHPNKETTTCR